jgi:protein-tyrosine phosphatase
MVDIHTHVLPFVDDGSQSVEDSLALLTECARQGVTDIILTPHFRGEYALDKEQILEHFAQFKNQVKQSGLNINLYIGREIAITDEFKSEFLLGKYLTLNSSKYVLIECSFNKFTDIAEVVYELKSMGYLPIVAHFERYMYVDLDMAYEIKRIGGYIQVNAGSFVGKQKRKYVKFVKALFKNGLVDFVSSDIHFNREVLLSKAEKYVKKKYGEQVSNAVFNDNAQKIIKG